VTVASACLDEARAAAFAAHELSADERAAVIAHAEDCDECRRVLAALLRRDSGADWSPGKRVSRYIVREKIGRGGMGAVWRAEDLELHRPVALKRLHVDADREARARLVREARAAAQLQHPNVVAVYEVGDAEGEPFLAMELVDGETLARWLRTPRPRHEIVDMLVQAGRGLAAAHARGLVHRDFKPENVLIDREHRARVVDFGLARAGDTPVARVAQAGALVALTQTGAIAGTPAYLAPELVEGTPPDERSDQYAFAITCFEALHGMHPFAGGSADAIWTEMAAGRIREGRRDVPARLDRLVRRGLSVEPGARWPSVTALVDALARRRRRRWPWVVAGGVVALANLFVVLALRTPDLDTCKAGARLIDQIWNPTVRDENVRRFAVVAPHQTGLVAQAGRLTDEWADAWRLAHDAACHVTDEQRRDRLSCLDRELGDLRAQLAVWAHPDSTLAARAVKAISTLPFPEACAAAGPQAGRISPAVQAWLTAFLAMQRAARYRECLPLIPDAIAMAEATGDGAMLARTLLAAGNSERRVGQRDRARAYYTRAANEAARANADGLMLEALVLEGMVAIDQGHPLDALGIYDAAAALVERTKVDPAYGVPIGRGEALKALGRLPEAIDAYQRGIAVLAPLAARDRRFRTELAAALAALGGVYGSQYRQAEGIELLRRALAIEEEEYASQGPEVADTLHDLATQESAIGRWDDAVAHYRRARDLLIATYGEHYDQLPLIDLGLADIESAREHFREAQAIYERVLRELAPAQVVAIAGAEQGLGRCARELDDPRGAAEHYRRALAAYAGASMAGTQVADVQEMLALALVDMGQFTEARIEAERALAQCDAAGTDDYARVDAFNVLAQAEHHEHHDAKAIAWERKALAALHGHTEPGADEVRKAIEANLRAWAKN
jgi:tetratricopeptide (TPR) repeat protein